MPSPLPGMDPYLEKNPVFHELHTQMLAEMQAALQPQIRPKYVARLERHLSEGSVWGLDVESLDRKERDVAIVESRPAAQRVQSTVAVAEPTVIELEQLEQEELDLRKQRRIVIYVNDRPRLAVTGIELLSPSNKQSGSVARQRYLEKRASALHGGLHWVEIDLLRGGARPALPVPTPKQADYLAYVAQATPSGWKHLIYAWRLRNPLPRLRIPLLGEDHAVIDLAAAFRTAFDRIAADDEIDYHADPPPPRLRAADRQWIDRLLRASGLLGSGKP